MTDTRKLLPLVVAGPLAHALVSGLAEQNGIRTLSIKGPVNIADGLRPPYVASDADLLVEPDRLDDLVGLLAEFGWRVREDDVFPRVLESHSVTLLHPEWPCDLDLHRRFPGILLTDAPAFDLLWRDRRRLDIAESSCAIPSKPAAWAIALLHAYRDSSRPASAERIRELVDHARVAFTGDEHESVRAFLRESGAMESLRPTLVELGQYEDNRFARSPAAALWDLRRTAGLSPAVPLFLALARGQYREAVRMLGRILLPGGGPAATPAAEPAVRPLAPICSGWPGRSRRCRSGSPRCAGSGRRNGGRSAEGGARRAEEQWVGRKVSNRGAF